MAPQPIRSVPMPPSFVLPGVLRSPAGRDRRAHRRLDGVVAGRNLSGKTAAGWRELETVPDNSARRRVHRLGIPERLLGLRVTVHATHGIEHARIVEIRASRG